MPTSTLDSAEAIASALTAPGIVCISFEANWVGTCTRAAPVFEAIAADAAYSKAHFYRVHEDRVPPGLLETYAIRAYPTYAVFLHGKEAARVRALAGVAQASGPLSNRCRPHPLSLYPNHPSSFTRTRS